MLTQPTEGKYLPMKHLSEHFCPIVFWGNTLWYFVFSTDSPHEGLVRITCK